MSYIKIIQSGDLVERYEYERIPAAIGMFKRPRKPKEYKFSRPRRSDNIAKAKQSFRRLVRCNLQKGNPYLLTLTMLDILSYSDAIRCFTAFGQRAKRDFGQAFSWIAVAEFQRRGALHFHALVWGLDYDVAHSEKDTRRIQNLWRYGYVDIIPTDGSPKIATYLSKYMSKAMSDERLMGKRAYCSSRNVLRPVSVSTPTAVDLVSQELGLGDIVPLQDRSYGTLWLGRANYKSYSLYQNNYGKESHRIGG